MFGQILQAVIAIVVTVVATPAIGPVGAAMLGSTVSQGFGVATGIQDKFSWKAVGMAGVTAFASLGVGAVLGDGAMLGRQFVGDVVRGAATSLIGQGIGVATGLQDKFSWTGVAAAGVSAGVGRWAGPRIAKAGLGPVAGRTLTGMAAAIANAGTRSLIDGSSFGDNIIAALPDVIANTIGNLAADRLARSGGPSGDRPSDQGGRSPDEIVINREVVGGALRNLSGPTEYDGWSDDMRISLLEFDGRISSDTAAMIRARAVEIKIAARDQYEAENGGSGYSYKNFENGRNAIDLSTVSARENDLNRFEITHPGDKDIAPARAGLANNRALVNQWNEMAHKEVNGLIRMFVPPLDTAMSAYSIGTGTGTWVDGITVGSAILPGAIKGITVAREVAANEAAWARAAAQAEGPYSLVGANRAVIDPRKLTEYALNPTHPVGGNKARVFESAFGFNQSNASDLMAQLQSGVMRSPAKIGKVDQYGVRLSVDIPVVGPAGSGVVRTGWIYRSGSSTPELTTLFPK